MDSPIRTMSPVDEWVDVPQEPVKGVISENTPEEEGARTSQHDRWLAEQQEITDRKQLAQAVQAGLKQLDDDATTLETTAATIAQVRAAQARANRTTAKLIRLLGRSGAIAP